MCRIYGYLGNQTVSREILGNIGKMLINGGPNGQYLQEGQHWAIGNNRLAIQGLDGGIQPFYSNNIHAVYNGEIYNHVELRNFLKQKGYVFKDSCDGSVIIPLYELYGKDFVKYLDGMFAIAIIDERSEKKIIIANDSCSMKSVYYYWDKTSDTLYFASELTPLLQFPIQRTIRPEAIDEYLTGRSIWHNKTFFKDFYELGPSSLLIKTMGGNPKLTTYETKITSERSNGTNSFEESADYLHALMDNEVKQMVKADVPICVVTSGGLDSSYITSLAAKYVPNLECFNISYEGEWPSDEKSFAKEVADYYGVRYNQVLIKQNEFPEILSKTIHHIGQPNSAPHSLSAYALFKSINEQGFKVAIAGEGADEFFAGYNRFKTATFDTNDTWIDLYFDIMGATTQETRSLAYTNKYKEHLYEGKSPLLVNARDKIMFDEQNGRTRLESILNFDQKERFPSYILRRTDHLSMANSVEVRMPFCQPRITSFASSLPQDYLLDKTSVKKILYRAAKNLPQSILKRPKQPFTLPIMSMLKKGFILYDILNDTLSSNGFKERGIFEQKQIQSLIQQQLDAPSKETSDFLWSVMILELWLKHHNINL
jgi:asparagine synthase (glutamine-hydrolysing)